MNKIQLILMSTATSILISCNNGESTKEDHEGHEVNDSVPATTKPGNDTSAKDMKMVEVHYTNLDPAAAASIKEIVDHYLHIKNALADDNAREAAKGGKAMENAIKKLDKSLLTADQKTAYDRNEEEMKEHAEHIAENADKISHQRSHFVMMSEVVYDLVRNFGAGRPLYHDHCPMARDNKGAMWISETKAIRNPYFGAEMPACGTVEEMIK
jgi:NADH dehydrogenase/NADH:ubiquinone oxidoreductase subunit G